MSGHSIISGLGKNLPGHLLKGFTDLNEVLKSVKLSLNSSHCNSTQSISMSWSSPSSRPIAPKSLKNHPHMPPKSMEEPLLKGKKVILSLKDKESLPEVAEGDAIKFPIHLVRLFSLMFREIASAEDKRCSKT